jgi:hypothetical protein
MTRNLILIIFGIVVAMALLLIVIAIAAPVPNAAGIAHPDFPGMQVGGDGTARLQPIGLYAFLFQTLFLLLIVCLTVLSVAKARRTRELMFYMVASFALMMVVWWQMYSGHQHYLESGETGYFLGFPIATAWQAYGTWFGAVPLIVVYCLGFRRFILSKADEAEFNRLLNEHPDRERQQ